MTFGLVYTVYVARDSRRGPLGAVGPLAIEFIVGANVSASGPFMGGSMNAACSFGFALVGGSFKNHVVYWVRPLIGAALAGNGVANSRLEHTVKPNALRSYLVKFISSFLFAFAAVGSAMSSWRMMSDDAIDLSALVAVAVANAFALLVAVYAMANISSGHVNPAATFGIAVSSLISVPMAILYWISQLVGSIMACLFLKVITVAQHVPLRRIPQEMTGFRASILEGVITFGLVYTVYVARDPSRGPLGAIGPLGIRFIVGANALASGSFLAGSMNLAYSFGFALVGGSFKNHVVYWVRPLIGAALAGILYDNVVFLVQVPGIADGVGV
ncbi:putative aquaporin TIP5-1 [Camellia lanceoleosa]|uniref:Aquaporin TIP5-1 n=1 Tax=Camellia lanceoleosa TaxID=1840588 RepID=A0ACC0GLJ4_9ERIC|nr:putative aquaporin TIP5-1 [Camellia lanceoleosa]